MRIRQRMVVEAAPVTGFLECVQKTSPTGEWEEWNASRDSTGVSPHAWEEVHDVVTSGAKKRLASGEIINNPFLHKTTSVTPPPLTQFQHLTVSNLTGLGEVGAKWQGSYVAFSYAGNAPYMGLPEGWDVAKQRAIDLAVTQAHANVNESELMALVTIAESEKTVASLVKCSRDLVRLAVELKKLNLKMSKARSKRILKELQEQYMALRYGARPIVADMVGAMKAVTKTRERVRKTFRGEGTASCEEARLDRDVLFFYETIVDVNHVSKYSVSAKAGVLCDAVVSALSPYGMGGIQDIPNALWELIPFSFVLDWAANVGATISSHVPNGNINVRASWVNVIGTWTVKSAVTNARSTQSSLLFNVENSSTVGPCEYGRQEIALERFVSPSIRTFPQFDVKLDMFKLADLSIILRGLSRKM